MSKKALLVVLPLFAVLCVLVLSALMSGDAREVVFKDFGHAFVNTSRLISIMRVPGAQVDVSENICVLSPDSSIKIKGDKISYGSETLASQLPMFFDNNSYIYIPWEKAVFLDRNLELRNVEGNAFLIKEGFFGEDYTRRDSAKDMLLLSCTKNLFVSLGEFTVTTLGESFTVEPMDLVLFDGYSIKTMAVSDTKAERSAHGIAKDSLVTLYGRTYVMSDFLSVLGLSVERDSSSTALEAIDSSELEEKKEPVKSIEKTILKIPEETFQYFLGHRYEMPEDLEVYNLDGIWYQKREDLASPLESIPIYGEKYVYLPAEFGMIDTKQQKQSKLPAFSKIERKEKPKEDEIGVTSKENGDETETTEEEFTVMSFDGSESKVLPQGVIYDGTENYLFTAPVKLEWKGACFTLAPLSYVSYDGVDRLEFYDAGEDMFYSYILDMNSIKVTFNDGTGVDLINRSAFLGDGQSMLIVSDPGMYGSYFG
ncbi:MAG: hypothetical protein IK138_07595 [Lachnospiraceae bacterium]|nr:hypothetical protein [Lachnospiraceae bacterium]